MSLKLSINNLKKLFLTSLSINSEPYSNNVLAVLINHSYVGACFSFNNDILTNKSFLKLASVLVFKKLINFYIITSQFYSFVILNNNSNVSFFNVSSLDSKQSTIVI